MRLTLQTHMHSHRRAPPTVENDALANRFFPQSFRNGKENTKRDKSKEYVIKQTRTSINIQVWGRSSYRGKKLRLLVSSLILGFEKGLIL